MTRDYGKYYCKYYWLLLAAAAAMVLAAACAPGAPAPAPKPAKEAGPIKIGVLLPFTGGSAYGGITARQGMEMGFEEGSYRAAGREIQLFFEDDEVDPATAVTKARKLVEATGVHFIIGPWMDHTGLAVEEYTKPLGVLTLSPMAGAEVRTTNFPSNVNLQFTDLQTTAPYGEWAYKKGYRRAVLAASDYAWGHSVAEGFEKGFTSAGGTVVDRVFVPLGTADMSPYITRISGLVGKADMIWDFVVADDGVRFHQEFARFGLADKLPRLSGTDALGTELVQQVGKAADGALVLFNWFPEIDVPASKAFVEKAQKKKLLPDWYLAAGYHAAQVVLRTLEAVKGNAEDRAAFLKALLDLKMDDSIFGAGYRFDPDMRAAYVNFYIVKLKWADGKVTREIVDTLKNVSPVWKK